MLINYTLTCIKIYTHSSDDTTATDAGAVILLYLQKQVDEPVISWRKITSGLGGFNIRLQVHT